MDEQQQTQDTSGPEVTLQDAYDAWLSHVLKEGSDELGHKTIEVFACQVAHLCGQMDAMLARCGVKREARRRVLASYHAHSFSQHFEGDARQKPAFTKPSTQKTGDRRLNQAMARRRM